MLAFQRLSLQNFVSNSRLLGTAAKKYLQEKGFDEKVSEKILDAFPQKPVAVSDLKSLGESGLKELSDSIKHQIEELEAKGVNVQEYITIKVLVPRENYEFDIVTNTGKTFYDLVKENSDLSQLMECSCSGNAACSTCHVIVDPAFFEKLLPPQEDELDMIDLAWGVTDTSRLGCQIKFDKSLDGLKVTLPDKTNDLFN